MIHQERLLRKLTLLAVAWTTIAGVCGAVSMQGSAVVASCTTCEDRFLAYLPSVLRNATEGPGVRHELISQIGGGCEAIDTDNGLVYLVAGRRLVVLDATGSPASVLGRSDLLPFTIGALDVADGYAYLGTNGQGLVVFDVRTPSKPELVGTSVGEGYVTDVHAVGGLAYVVGSHLEQSTLSESDTVGADEAAGPTALAPTPDHRTRRDALLDWRLGLAVYDVSRSQRPLIVGFYETLNVPWAVDVVGGYAYVAADMNGLRVIDVRSPADPHEVAFYDTHGVSAGVQVDDGYAYVAERSSTEIGWALDPPGIRVFDVSDVDRIRLVGTIEAPGEAYDVQVVGDVAYVAAYEAGLWLVDISDPSSPKAMVTHATGGYAKDVHVRAPMVYTMDEVGVHAYDLTDAANPKPVVLGLDVFSPMDGCVMDDVLLMVTWNGDLRRYDIADAAQPTRLDTPALPGRASAVVSNGAYAYVIGYVPGSGKGRLWVLDVSGRTTINVVGSLELAGFTRSLDYADGHVFTVVRGQDTMSSDIAAIDVSAPSAPRLAGTTTVSGFVVDIDVAQGVAYAAAGSDGLHIVDVSNATAMSHIATYATEEAANRVHVVDQVAYIAGIQGDLELVSVVDSAAPRRLSVLDLIGTISNLWVDRGLAYLTGYNRQLRVVDVSMSAQPVAVDPIPVPGYPRTVQVHDDLLFVFCTDAGLLLYRVP